MNKFQIGIVLAAVALFSGLYFGFDTRPSGQKAETDVVAIMPDEAERLLEASKSRLTAPQIAELEMLQQQLDAAQDASDRVELLKRQSGWWYASGDAQAAGILAERVAQMNNSDTAWSVAGATFFGALQNAVEPDVRQYCAEHAEMAFNRAAEINPGRVEHRVNLALVYAENPPPDNPMQAVLLLRELESQHPDNAAVYNALGRLAIKTGQWERAVERLEKAWSLDSKNPNTPCLLARAYEGAGNGAKAAAFREKCR